MLVRAGGAAFPQCAPGKVERGQSNSSTRRCPKSGLGPKILFPFTCLFVQQMRKSLENQEGRAWFVCILLPRFWYLQAHIFSLRHRLLLFSCWLAHTKRNISRLLLPQSSGSQECCWLRRKFFQKAPISHWFPKKYSVFLQNYSFLSCTLTTLWPLLQIHVQHWYLHSSYLQHSSPLSQSTGTQTLDFKCLDIFGNLDRAHQSIVRKPQQSHAIQELSYFLHFSTKTIYHDVFRPHPATLNIQKFRDIYTWAASNFASQDDWAGMTTATPIMMTVELGISMKILWRVLFLILFFFFWHRLVSHMAHCWTLHQLKEKHLWLTLENTKLCLWAGSGWKCSWQMETAMSFSFHCSTGRRHFLHWAMHIKVYSLRGWNILLLISCSMFPIGNRFQITRSALNGTWRNENPFPALASGLRNQMAPSLGEQNSWSEQSPAPRVWNSCGITHTQGTPKEQDLPPPLTCEDGNATKPYRMTWG